MNNQTILDKNNQSMTVDLICYFNSNGKKYAFYNKNETVQDGLIKMYVAEENTGLSNDITQDEWNNLKKIMQGIITGNTSGIQFLPYNNSVKLNESKAIALNDANINAIKTAYKNSVGTNDSDNGMLNKDLLSQSFGGNTETVVNNSEPVQISSIPGIQNDLNMESTPVNLNMDTVENGAPAIEPVMPIVEPVSNVEPVVPSIEPLPSVESVEAVAQPMPSIEPIMSTNDTVITQPVNEVKNEDVLSINSIKPSGIDSGFKVSDAPNIFDNPNPYQITEEEINNPELPDMNNVFNSSPVVENKVVDSENDISLEKKIELNNRKIKLFEELASIYKEENELLKKEDDSLEKTASNLFNNNGTLNENEVLGN